MKDIEIYLLRKALAEREAECLRLREVAQKLLDAYLRGSSATEVKAEKAMKEALSTPQLSSYLEQWVADNFQVVATAEHANRFGHICFVGSEQLTELMGRFCSDPKRIKLYARKD